MLTHSFSPLRDSFVSMKSSPLKSIAEQFELRGDFVSAEPHGNGRINDQNVPLNTLVALGSADHSPEFIAGEQGARFIVISGKPINEPIVQYGPFVMNTKEEIDQAMRDFQSNNFVRDRAWINRRK